MRRKSNTTDETGAPLWNEGAEQPHEFFPDEASNEIRNISNDLRDRVAKVEVQMMAQYTAMSAYAQIAQNATEDLRSENRNDLDRSQATIVGLVEKVRREVSDSILGLQNRIGSGDGSDAARLDSLENRFQELAAMLQQSIETQSTLAEQVTVLLEEKMHREGWLVSNGTGEDLSLR